VSVISTPFPWSPLKFHSDSTPWSGNGVEFQKSSGVGVRVCGAGVGVGVGVEFKILKFSETSMESICKAFKNGIDS
jgi:hypothetical protein